MPSPVLIVFAGPNGSGKSTLTQHILESGYSLGEYINPDEIAASLEGSYAERTRHAQLIADARRESYLRSRVNFAFETVMSHPSKVTFMQEARNAGYLVTLYFVSVTNPEICVQRVAQRVALGGHDVPTQHILDRYHRTMALLSDAARICHRTVLFDNSTADLASELIGPRPVAEIVGCRIAWYPPIPPWVQMFAEEFERLSAG